jgi:hypothetical protein
VLAGTPHTARPVRGDDGEPRLIGWGAEQWLKRFDIKENEMMAYKAKLQDEPKLTKATTLPERL